MLWLTLYNRLGKQPLSYTNKTHIQAVIGGRRMELDMKYDAAGRPYLIERANAPKKGGGA